jgi:hypothetical protein
MRQTGKIQFSLGGKRLITKGYLKPNLNSSLNVFLTNVNLERKRQEVFILHF